MIATAGYFNGLKTLADGSVKLELSTQEITPETAGQLFSLRGKYVKLLISEENVSLESQEQLGNLQLEAPKKKGKSKGQLLRNVLYRVWENQGSVGDSNEFYEAQMEIIIQHFKDKYLQ